jgi:26S proteasome regulatory subunit N2
LYEDSSFQSRLAAALLASKVYYHLGEYEDSLSFALAADSLFDISSSDQFVETIIGKFVLYLEVWILGNK